MKGTKQLLSVTLATTTVVIMISAIATIALSLLHIMEKNIVMDIMMEQFKLIGTLKVGMIWT
jgi:predicted nucleic acid-binding protein